MKYALALDPTDKGNVAYELEKHETPPPAEHAGAINRAVQELAVGLGQPTDRISANIEGDTDAGTITVAVTLHPKG